MICCEEVKKARCKDGLVQSVGKMHGNTSLNQRWPGYASDDSRETHNCIFVGLFFVSFLKWVCTFNSRERRNEHVKRINDNNNGLLLLLFILSPTRATSDFRLVRLLNLASTYQLSDAVTQCKYFKVLSPNSKDSRVQKERQKRQVWSYRAKMWSRERENCSQLQVAKTRKQKKSLLTVAAGVHGAN